MSFRVCKILKLLLVIIIQIEETHLITYSSGGAQSQIYYILTRLRDRKLVENVRVVPSEEFVTQHRLLIYPAVIRFHEKS